MKRLRVSIYLKLLAFWNLLVSAARETRYIILRALYVGGYRLWRWAGRRMIDHDTLFRAQWETDIDYWQIARFNSASGIMHDPRYDRD